MTEDQRPVVVAFDGSDEARAAVREAAVLFGGRELVVVTAWEPGLTLAWQTMPDATGVTYLPPSAQEVETVDRIEREHAVTVAEAGVRLAAEHGARARPRAVPEELDVAESVEAVAADEDAAAIVVGSRGLGTVRAGLLGSTSKQLLQHARRPVVVVRPSA